MADERHDVERLGAFTDGVIAIAITLLVLDVQLPEGASELTERQLFQALLALWPNYLGYLISFMVIGNYWIIHTARFRSLKALDTGFVWLNIFFLLTIGFIPFVTSVLSENSNRISIILYAATMALASALLSLMTWHSERRGLMAEIPQRAMWRRRLMSVMTPAVFLSSIVVAEFDADVAPFVWFLLFPLGVLIRGRGKDPDPLSGDA